MGSRPKKPNREVTSVIAQINTKQKVFMYSCLVPVFGAIPALTALISDRSNKQLKDVAKVSIITVLIWLSSYIVFGDSNQIAQELSKATLTSGYFVLNVYLMWRLSQGKKVSIPRSPKSL